MAEQVEHGMGRAGARERGHAPRRERGPRRGRRRWMAWFLAGILAALLAIFAGALWVLRPPSPGRVLTIDEVVRDTAVSPPKQPKVKEVTFLDEDARIVGTAVFDPGAPEEKFWTNYPKSDAITGELFKTFYSYGVNVRIDAQLDKRLIRFVTQYLLPLVILADLFALLFYISTQRGSATDEFVLFGRTGARRLRERESTTFADVAAADEVVVELSEVRDYLADAGAFTAMGATPPKGVLLVGPPGCGKTLLARAVAGEAEASFYAVSGSEFVESLVGVGAARVRDLFRQARANAPAIIFVDELDAVGRRRGAGLGQGHDEREQTLNELLVQMDGFSSSEGVVVMAATNRPDILDPALLRAGRFDRHITVERPDVAGRLAILQLHARGKHLANPDAALAHTARSTPGLTGADLANVLNEAALLAVRERAAAIARHHLDEGVERVLAGPRRRTRILSPEEERRIACHEAGHAVVAAAMGKGSLLRKLSVVARGTGAGHLAMLQEDTTMLTRDEMRTQIAVALSGSVAEELLLGQPSTGSEQDVERATDIARDMAGRYGMSEALGMVRVLREDREVFLGRDYLSTRDVSPPTLEMLDGEIRRIVSEERARARTVLVANRATLEALSASLIAHETLQGPELEQALADVAPSLAVATT